MVASGGPLYLSFPIHKMRMSECPSPRAVAVIGGGVLPQVPTAGPGTQQGFGKEQVTPPSAQPAPPPCPRDTYFLPATCSSVTTTLSQEISGWPLPRRELPGTASLVCTSSSRNQPLSRSVGVAVATWLSPGYGLGEQSPFLTFGDCSLLLSVLSREGGAAGWGPGPPHLLRDLGAISFLSRKACPSRRKGRKRKWRKRTIHSSSVFQELSASSHHCIRLLGPQIQWVRLSTRPHLPDCPQAREAPLRFRNAI